MNDKNFVKFKICNQKLVIEQGQYQIDHLRRENWLCPLCKSNHVIILGTETDVHSSIQSNNTWLEKKSPLESIKLIMNSNDYHVNKLVIKFTSPCMKILDSLLVM